MIRIKGGFRHVESRQPVYVTRSFMPPLSEVTSLLEGVWERAYLTNNGPLLLELERRVSEYLGVPQTVTVLNGTLALELALEALDVRGEVITTPFTFVATSTAIRRTGSEPVFVDIDPNTWNIDPSAVEAAITPRTVAILAVHVFGCPCDLERLAAIATKHGIRLIYDAAHAFGVRVGERSIFSFGDISTTSFHATKLFHTVEGGACFSEDEAVRNRLRQLRFFGTNGEGSQTAIGTNAKMTEVSAAVGLANLTHMPEILRKRRERYERYTSILSSVPEITFQKYDASAYNYSYFAILLRDEERLKTVVERMREHQIFPRRYFWPLVCDMPIFSESRRVGALPVSRNVSSRVLSLPFWPDLPDTVMDEVCELVGK